jgi:hypothetical protein
MRFSLPVTIIERRRAESRPLIAGPRPGTPCHAHSILDSYGHLVNKKMKKNLTS